MKEQPSATSPFAMLDTREQMEQWIWWHCQKQECDESEKKDLRPCALPELKPDRKEKQDCESAGKPDMRLPASRHRQYDAVLHRMNLACKQAKDYIPWTDSL